MPEDILFVLRKYNMIAIFDQAVSQIRSSASAHPSSTVVHSLGHAPLMPEADKVDQAMQIPFSYEITPDYAVIDQYLAKLEAKGWLKLDPKRLNWSPFILSSTGVLKKKSERSGTADHAGGEAPAASDTDVAHVAPAALAPIDPTSDSTAGAVERHTVTSLANATNPAFHSAHADNFEKMQVDLPPVDQATLPAAAPEAGAIDGPATGLASTAPVDALFEPPMTVIDPPTRTASPSPRKRIRVILSPVESTPARKRRKASAAEDAERRRVEEERASLALIHDLTRADRGLRSTATPSPTMARATRTPLASARPSATPGSAASHARSTRGSAKSVDSVDRAEPNGRPPPLPNFTRIAHGR
jgi:hypothetical protein